MEHTSSIPLNSSAKMMNTINAIPELMAGGLVLRGFELHDAVNLLRHGAGDAPDKYGCRAYDDVALDSSRFMTYLANSISFKPNGIYLVWVVVNRLRMEIVGTISFSQLSEREGTVDHAITDLTDNQEIAVTAVSTVIGWAFKALPGLEIIRAECSAEDPVSEQLHMHCHMQFIHDTLQLMPDMRRAPRRISEWMITRSIHEAVAKGAQDASTKRLQKPMGKSKTS